MQSYYQYQVILKPEPGNPQELYLKSLEAIGIDLRKHDVRFVEDNWKSPALGAWGLGWEVWLDGQEITQYTYFQQSGGQKLDPVSVEITYGVERIVLALQGRDSAWNIEWTEDILYRDIFLQSEIEHCRYYFDVADVDTLKRVYESYASEHQRCLEAGLVVPAYDYVLKCSHLFNVLDTRGAIGVTERAGYFRRMAAMSRNIAKLYLEQREKLGFPQLNNGQRSWVVTETRTYPAFPRPINVPQDFLLEIGTEELPAGDLDFALNHLKSAAPKLFEDLRLSHQGIEIHGTPRRLVLIAHQVAPSQPDEEKLVRGPSANIAFDAEGKLTQAGLGFAKKQGIDPSLVKAMELDGGKYAAASIATKGKAAAEVISEALPAFLLNIRFTDSMRWNSNGIAFSRPIRWIVSILGTSVLPFEFARVGSHKITRGSRANGSPEIVVDSLKDYLATMEAQGIIIDPSKRRATIWEQVQKLAAEVGGQVAQDEALLDEVNNLVEQPTALRGTYEARFLELPRDVLITVMKKKQRYFPVERADGTMMPYFIGVRNGSAEFLDTVILGNEHVLTARFADAAFFFREDLKKKLSERADKLRTMTFQEKLGSLQDKTERLIRYVPSLGKLLTLSAADLETAHVAAAIAKADQVRKWSLK